MWVHFIIFMTAFGTVLVWKAGWLRLDGIADKESLRLFLIVAVCGNLAGMAMTLTMETVKFIRKATESRRVRMGLIRRNCRFP